MARRAPACKVLHAGRGRIDDMTDLKPLVHELRAIREKWGMSRQDLADLIGVVPRTLMLWEVGKKPPSALKLVRWAGQLGYDLKPTLR
jgi:DNA-binding transcriptional regulator YiaG